MGKYATPLTKNDINILNLETTLTTSITKTPKVFNFKATPDKVAVLQAGNITVVNTANNHILDFGPAGLIETLKTLDQAETYHVGSGLTSQQARAPVILKKDGIKIGILGLTDNEPSWKAKQNSVGTNYITIGPVAQELKEDIKRLITPVVIQNMQVNKAHGKEREETVNKMKKLSQELNQEL